MKGYPRTNIKRRSCLARNGRSGPAGNRRSGSIYLVYLAYSLIYVRHCVYIVSKLFFICASSLLFLCPPLYVFPHLLAWIRTQPELAFGYAKARHPSTHLPRGDRSEALTSIPSGEEVEGCRAFGNPKASSGWVRVHASKWGMTYSGGT